MRRRFWAPGRARDANGVDWLGKKVTESGDVALILGEGASTQAIGSRRGYTAIRDALLIGCCTPSKKVST